MLHMCDIVASKANEENFPSYSSLSVIFDWLVNLSYSETTDGDKFDLVLELIAGMGRVIFKLFQHPSLAIVKAAGLIMKAIIEVGYSHWCVIFLYL